MDAMIRDAHISECGTWRWWLSRFWDTSKPTGAFISLNPSTADHRDDDMTITKDIGFATRWGWGGFYKLNLFALRSKDPKALWAADDPVGPLNDETLSLMLKECAVVVAAWGSQDHPRFTSRLSHVLNVLDGTPLHCIGEPTKDGQPRHPSRIAYSTPLKLWRPA